MVLILGSTIILGSSSQPLEIEEAEDVAEALDKIRAQPWNVVILDLGMPGSHGMDLLKHIKREQPQLPVLVLSAHPEEHYGVRVLRAGAWGYLSKSSAPEEILDAVEKLLAHKRYLSPLLAELLAKEVAGDNGHAKHHALSDREYEVLRLLASGKTPAAIAAELCLSTKTIYTYRARILAKLGLKNNAELIHYAVKHALID